MSGCYPNVIAEICIHGTFKGQSCFFCELEKKITTNYASVNNRIESLHEHKLRQIDENRKISRRVDEITSYVKNCMDLIVGACPIDIHKDYHSRIEKLEKFNQFDTELLSILKNRIDKLEEKISEKYSHPNVIGRLERLESENKMRQDTIGCMDSAYNEAIGNVERRLDDLEEDFESHCEASIQGDEYVDEQIRAKFEEIDDLKSKFADFMQKSSLNSQKVPFKCPVCSGEIRVLIDPSTPLSGIQAMFGKRDGNGMYYKDCLSCDGKGIIWG